MNTNSTPWGAAFAKPFRVAISRSLITQGSRAARVNPGLEVVNAFGVHVRDAGPCKSCREQGATWREQNPIRLAANFKTPIMLSVGENDFRVPLNQTLENWSVLQRLRMPSKLIVWPEENHWMLKGENSRYWYQELYGWLRKYLGET